MAVYEFEKRVPVIGETSYVSHSASVIGKVTIGEECYIAPGASVKGDYGEIHVGNGTSIQDNVIIHARPSEQTVIGNNVTLGHGCIIHNATVKDDAVIGMGAIVSDYSVVGEWAIIGEGAVVRARFDVPDGMIAVGVPAKVIGEVQDHHREELTGFKAIYRDLARRYPLGLKKLKE
ncbi:MAG: gamma carbonic anhydrase family protein [Candidatus Thorarchaeota archaeon SMTZ1-45]|nr:MAG: gamma carbonic anhydrase family protein [Candidatus Thorarchaeota archaeon SMTZ1-45]